MISSCLGPLISRCQEEGIRTRVDLGFLPRTFPSAHMENLRHVPLLTLGSGPNNELALFAKRVADFVLCVVALVVLSPLMLILALLVRLTSPGPVLYRQTRCGLNGRRFTLLKFRSMVANAESLRPELESLNELEGPAFKIADDPRCTSVGRWLRKFSLDELPQLWNVLWGDMSFVGPRPPLPEEVERYEPWQRRRLRMRPGALRACGRSKAAIACKNSIAWCNSIWLTSTIGRCGFDLKIARQDDPSRSHGTRSQLSSTAIS